MFDPHLEIGQTIKNPDLTEIFKCGNMGGMRRAKATNTLVIVSDYTKGLYHDKWIGGILHYTGMGKNGDQDIHWAQNATLAGCARNGVDVHLFEVMEPGEYIYCGRIELVDKPYTEYQKGDDGQPRLVWMFPIRPVPDNDVKKPSMYVFKDMEDYRAHGKDVDVEYEKILRERRKGPGRTGISTGTGAGIGSGFYSGAVGRTGIDSGSGAANGLGNTSVIGTGSSGTGAGDNGIDNTRQAVVPPKPVIVVPPEIIGKQIRHKAYGLGTVTEIKETFIVVSFDTVGEKTLEYEICTEKKLIEVV